MSQKKYCMYVVDSNDEFDKSTAGYFEVRESAKDYSESDELESLMLMLISGLNEGDYSDQNYYFITDETEGIILMH
jgi:hypothetical protein